MQEFVFPVCSPVMAHEAHCLYCAVQSFFFSSFYSSITCYSFISNIISYQKTFPLFLIFVFVYIFFMLLYLFNFIFVEFIFCMPFVTKLEI